MAGKSELVHIEQCSLQLEDSSVDHAMADIKDALSIGAHAVGLTELNLKDQHTLPELHALAGKQGYNLIHPQRSDVAVLVRDDLHIVHTDHLEPVKNRWLVSASWMWQGSVMTFDETHIHTTHVRGGVRSVQQQALTRKVQRDGKGGHLVFWGSDTNRDMAKPNTFRTALERAGLVTIQAALHDFRPTHPGNSTIDVVGHYRRDRRVHPDHVVVHPRGFSDHCRVSGYYRVAG